MLREFARLVAQLLGATGRHLATLFQVVGLAAGGLGQVSLAQLQQGKKAARQMYDAACLRLGIPNDLEAEEEGAAEI